MAEEKKPEKITMCFYVDRRVMEKIKEISETLGIPQSEVVNRVILDPRTMEVFEKAVQEMKKLKGGEKGGGQGGEEGGSCLSCTP